MEGSNYFDMKRDPFLVNGDLVLFHDGDQVMVSTDAESVRFLLISGKPIGEPVAWYGPIVMNTNDECVSRLRNTITGRLSGKNREVAGNISRYGENSGRSKDWIRRILQCC